jgi:hypothetical protein
MTRTYVVEISFLSVTAELKLRQTEKYLLSSPVPLTYLGIYCCLTYSPRLIRMEVSQIGCTMLAKIRVVCRYET